MTLSLIAYLSGWWTDVGSALIAEWKTRRYRSLRRLSGFQEQQFINVV